MSVVAYDSESGKGAVLYDGQTTLEFILSDDKTITMLGGDTVKYGDWEDLDLDSPLLIKVFNLFSRSIDKIFNIKKIKTYEDWNGDITDYLNINDIVDNEIIEHFRNVLPPKTDTNYMLQVGEVYDHIFDNKTNKYKGICFIGENIDKSSL